ncbi:gas vesicle protein GvpJ [Halococcus thailandensis]|uniref:Gas vesicle protein GvpA n=1 Tax=Halococcus thailandensis JCM 13552 TaxID=1227457 RepID=M0N825_9EURY|nr:gas vesicle protein [Halococcus thailandensis]EMA54087.1 gas vesicle protein GvpA [Halococcus thailandensis JCM 13552]
MSNSGGPTRQSDSLADVVEMLLDKGVVINADIVVSIGDTELLGVQLRAAIASFETAAEYGLEFPDGTDMRRVEQASGRSELEDDDTVTVEGGEDDAALDDEEQSDTERQSAPELGTRPNDGARAESAGGGGDEADGDEGGDEDASDEDADGESASNTEQAAESDAAAEEADDDD